MRTVMVVAGILGLAAGLECRNLSEMGTGQTGEKRSSMLRVRSRRPLSRWGLTRTMGRHSPAQGI